MKLRQAVVCSAMVGLLVSMVAAVDKGGNDETGAYEVVPNWPVSYPAIVTSSTPGFKRA